MKSDIFSRLTNSTYKSKDPGKASKKKHLFDFSNAEIVSVSPNEIIFTETLPEADRRYVLKDTLSVLNTLDKNDLLRSISHFKQLNLETVSDPDLKRALDDIVHFNLMSSVSLPENQHIYRARNHTFQLGSATEYFKLQSEIWYPKPEHLKNYGRLNTIGQPIMYASLDAMTPIHEIRSKEDTQFALMKYKVKPGHSLNLHCIAIETLKANQQKLDNYGSLTSKGKENWKLINEFIYQEFTKKVPYGKEYQYRSTIQLLRIYDMPGIDGFIYPSMEKQNGYNVAIKPTAADKSIEFVGLAYFTNKSYNKKVLEPRDLYCHQKWAKSVYKGKLVYEAIGPCEIEFEGMPPIMKNEVTRFDENKNIKFMP